jgi:hypothetical protein
MLLRTAFVDDQLAAHYFNTDEIVRKPGLHGNLISPYTGRVLFSNTSTGVVSVQWPWGEEQEKASELIHDVSGDYVPPLYDTSYSSWERSRYENSKDTAAADKKWRSSLASSILRKYEEKTLPLYRAACKAMHHGLDEVTAFIKISMALADIYGSDAIRRTVANLYGEGNRIAIYWKDQKRRYRVTQKEKNSGELYCPRCKSPLKPRVYRQGHRVLACKNCGFAIHPRDLK